MGNGIKSTFYLTLLPLHFLFHQIPMNPVFVLNMTFSPYSSKYPPLAFQLSRTLGPQHRIVDALELRVGCYPLQSPYFIDKERIQLLSFQMPLP